MKRIKICILGLALLATSTAQSQRLPGLPVCAVGIDGPNKIEEHTLGTLTIQRAPEGASTLWDVLPEEGASYIEDKGRLIFTGKPGRYRVTAIVIGKNADGSLLVERCRHEITIERAGVPPVPPDTPPPPGGGEPKPTPRAALGRIQFGSAGCTATPIWPRRADGKWDIITAAHCMGGVGSRGTYTTSDGRRIPVRVTVHERGSDLAWLVTEQPVDSLPYAVMARTMPAAGTKVWHAGFGVDKPGNREDGEVVNPSAGNNQATYMISVSSGDSGGGIFRDDTGEWLGAVCCTRAKGVRATVWAGTAVRAWQLRPGGAAEPADLQQDREMPRGAEHPLLTLDPAQGWPEEAPPSPPAESVAPTESREHPILDLGRQPWPAVVCVPAGGSK
jgi:hypothetical protein